MSVSAQLRMLANGVHPETGELLDENSLTQRPETIRMLFALAEEFAGAEENRRRKQKLTPVERRQKNIAEGRPPKSHFPWSEEEKSTLEGEMRKQVQILSLAAQFERSPLAIAVQAHKMKLISDDELDAYRKQADNQ